jgi:electron transfer flavoprotein beta subunit
MGADHGIHLESDSDYLDQAWFVAHGIHDSIGLEDYDLILCGVMSQDLCQGQVGPMIAGILGIPVVSSVIGLNLDPARNRITVVKEMEQATRQRITLEPPAVITIQTGSSQPRYPSLSNTLRAKKQELETISLKDYTPARKGSITQGVRHALPSRNGLFLDGPVEEKAKRLKDILREKGLL